MRPLQEQMSDARCQMSVKDERKEDRAFPIHPSSLIPHPSSLNSPPGAEKFLHQLPALGFKHARGNFDPVIQEISFTNSKV